MQSQLKHKEQDGGIDMMEKVIAFSKKYPTKKAKEEALRKMSDEEIDELIDDCPNIQGKIFYSKFKKGAKS